ncbi:hypothetical protein QPK87_25380 [Kamptonema cortianum]|nr:hypothetical protein [Kamptonema cortianum]
MTFSANPGKYSEDTVGEYGLVLATDKKWSLRLDISSGKILVVSEVPNATVPFSMTGRLNTLKPETEQNRSSQFASVPLMAQNGTV